MPTKRDQSNTYFTFGKALLAAYHTLPTPQAGQNSGHKYCSVPAGYGHF
ncbi:MAG: hypothetical protein ACRDC5_01725 [Vibrio sp.]